MDLISVFNIIIENTLQELEGEILFGVLNPSQRLYWGALLSSVVIAWCLLSLRGGSEKPWNLLQDRLFSKKILFHKSSQLDLKISLFNILLKTLITLPFIGLGFAFASSLLKLARYILPEFTGLPLMPSWINSALYTLLFFVINDFARFYHHYLMHKFRFLQIFHRTHHSAKVLTPLTLLRAHPIEMIIAQLRNGIIYSVTLTLSIFLFPGPLSAWDILGVNVFGFLFNFLGSNLRHTSIDLSFGYLEYVFISPRMHQYHHSDNPLHFNKNFGVSLSIWDIFFNTFKRPPNFEQQPITFGFPYIEKDEDESLRVALVAPIKNLFNS